MTTAQTISFVLALGLLALVGCTLLWMVLGSVLHVFRARRAECERQQQDRERTLELLAEHRAIRLIHDPVAVNRELQRRLNPDPDLKFRPPDGWNPDRFEKE